MKIFEMKQALAALPAVSFRLPDGRMADVDQRFFLLRSDGFDLSSAGWTEAERRFLAEHRWWSLDQIRASTETIWPQELADILERLTPMARGVDQG